jgi:CRISPR-associated exonuclease Cas4
MELFSSKKNQKKEAGMANVEKIKEFFEKNLRSALEKETENNLGDRSLYIGASDISGCLRSAYFNKISPVELPIEKLLIFERGHNTELIVEKMMGNVPYKREVEFTSSDYPYPIKVHIDFLKYDTKRKEATIIEVKSQNNDNFNVYQSYLLQVNLQWLVAEKELEKKGWKIKGAFIVIINNNSGKYEIIEVKKDENLQKLALEKAKKLREALIKGEAPEGEEQLYCSQCPYRSSCPTFCKGAVNQDILIDDVKNILELENQIKKLQNELKNKKEALKEYLEGKNITKAKVFDYQVTITKASSFTSLDTVKMKKEEPELYEKLLQKYGKTINRSSSIKIK